jgi:hypothetical protein
MKQRIGGAIWRAREAGDVNGGRAGVAAARATTPPGAGQHARLVPPRPQVPHTQGLHLPQIQVGLTARKIQNRYIVTALKHGQFHPNYCILSTVLRET